jgi:plastocyanin
MTVIYIPRYSYIPPKNWSDILGLSSPGFVYPYNFTVVIGVNNTIEWINNDTVEHTVIALSVPQGVSLFDSGFIGLGRSFTLTLTVPGVYKYDCAWHPWLAGLITVKPA